jgi:crossover junction endodeoxyribonuclease RusA
MPGYWHFTVVGVPEKQGSMRAFAGKNGRAFIRQGDSAKQRTKLEDWRHAVAEGGRKALGDTPGPTEEGPVTVAVSFLLPKPKSAPKWKRWPTAKPDLDKLIRAVFDALTGVLFKDDSQVVSVTASKAYAVDCPAGADIQVVPIGAREREMAAAAVSCAPPVPDRPVNV